ncbi:hypothetical protein [Tropicimonas sp. IMCC34043]|uniref:hypothetical protein n=1 Tax=Tropicimonas sp. IMCC34043 TaxID=2248760 RepID=UPI000E2622FB|nr:hypothetical protein [Tropicimonas sp. IMCC34043]
MDQIILFRIAERMTLTLVVLIVASVVMVGFWRTVQKLDVQNTGGIGGSFVFSTPVFVLLAIIGYAWVSLEHPIQVGPAAGGEEALQTASAGAGAFIGAAPGGAPARDPDFALHQAELKVRSLNCLARGQDLSPQVEDDLVQVKLGLLEPVWPAAWGGFGAFADWATGRSTAAPDAGARTAFDKEHLAC